jgi:hypothetical protein
LSMNNGIMPICLGNNYPSLWNTSPESLSDRRAIALQTTIKSYINERIRDKSARAYILWANSLNYKLRRYV